MAHELSPELPQTEAPEKPEPGFLPWVRRRLSALRPRTWKHYTALAVLLLLVLLIGLEWRWTNTYTAQVVVLPTTGEELTVGINPTTERLDFGDLVQGTSQNRPLILENNGRLPMRFAIMVQGDIRRFLKISDAFFVLDPGDTKQVDFRLILPRDAEPKEYSGRVMVFRMPWSPWP